MKISEMAPINKEIEHANEHYIDEKIIFRDSKTNKYKLLQIADIISGLIREFFEDTYYNVKSNFLRACAWCSTQSNIALCRNAEYKTQRRSVYNKIKYIKNLLIPKYSKELNGKYRYVWTLPEENIHYYSFLACEK